MDRENGTYGGDMFSRGERELEDAALACIELELRTIPQELDATDECRKQVVVSKWKTFVIRPMSFFLLLLYRIVNRINSCFVFESNRIALVPVLYGFIVT